MRVYGDFFWVQVFNPPTGQHFRYRLFPRLGLHVAWNEKEYKAAETKHGKEDEGVITHRRTLGPKGEIYTRKES